MVIISEIRHFLPRLFLDIRAREGCCGNLEFYLLWPSFHAAEEKRRLEIVFGGYGGAVRCWVYWDIAEAR